MALKTTNETASQTAGPYVHIGCTPNFSGIKSVYKNDLGSTLMQGDIAGQEIEIYGNIYDGDGELVLDAMVEIWQADSSGLYPSDKISKRKSDTNFTGWGRCACDLKTGQFQFKTIKPGQVAYDNNLLQAPHITFWIIARGINIGLHTRMYFDDEPEKNKLDPLLEKVQKPERIKTLLGVTTKSNTYQFDIHLQGENETVFLDI